MALTSGTRLGPYAITARIGVGGMGEVYRATDTTLDRQVAIKVLPESLASDAERIARFEREAKTLASLNHPNIAAVYGFEKSSGVHALVMELVEGPTLADRIAKGAIPVDDALPIAKQIAEAFEAAHEQGIIHRDLKPANIKLRPDGVVKVLDFGLAKALEPTGSDVLASQSPTITTPAMTQAGMILGTAAYMSPEQAKGKTVDKRSDVWAFGAVLYEMLTGKRAFDAEDVSETLAAVLRAEVDWARLPKDLSPVLGTYIRRCLQKDPKQRIRDIGDVALALEGAFETGGSRTVESAAVSQPAAWRRPVPVALAASLVGGLVIGLAVWFATRPAPQPPAPVARFQIPLAAGETFFNNIWHVVALSPTGTHVAYTVLTGLVLRPVDQLEAQPIPGTVGATGPFFSPDGQQIGFWMNGQLRRVSVSGGAPVTVAEVDTPWGASWGADNMILYSLGGQGIWRVPGTGGTPEQLIPLEAGELAQGPQLLPGGEWVLFTWRPAGLISWDQAQIVMQSLATNERIVLINGGRDARYLPTGHLVYGMSGALLAVPFDLDTRQITGGAVPLVEDVGGAAVATTGVVQFNVAATGSLVYVPGTLGFGGGAQQRILVWVDRQGQEEPLGAPPRVYNYPRLSPDGTRVALDLWDQEDDIWIWDLRRETLTRLTFDSGIDRFPVWAPDSTRVVFISGAPLGLSWKAADGTGAVERLTESAGNQFGHSFSPDGESLVLSETESETGQDLRVLSLAGDRGIETLVATEFEEWNGEISPDGRWMAYQSNQSGRTEVYVRPFPNVDDGLWQISTSGGTRPLWASDGRELFYRRGPALMTVPVQTEPGFTPGTPEVVFESDDYPSVGNGRDYDVSADGQRFLMLTPAGGAEDAGPPQIILVQNWFEELRRLVPTN